MLVALVFGVAIAGPCEPVATMTEAAEGGWLMEAERACLYKAVRRKKDDEEASRLLLADAHARTDSWTWTTLAMDHVERSPEDGDVWMKLVLDVHKNGEPHEVVALINQAVSHQAVWTSSGEDPRLVSMLRLRTYAALDARKGRGIDESVVRYAREWLKVAQDQAPAVAWQLAGETRDETN